MYSRSFEMSASVRSLARRSALRPVAARISWRWYDQLRRCMVSAISSRFSREDQHQQHVPCGVIPLLVRGLLPVRPACADTVLCPYRAPASEPEVGDGPYRPPLVLGGLHKSLFSSRLAYSVVVLKRPRVVL